MSATPIFADDHYVPILKGRAAEYDALAELKERLDVTPLIELMPIPWDYAEERPAVSLADHVAAAARNTLKAWGEEMRVFVDVLHLPPDARDGEGRHPMALFLGLARRSGLRAVPVLALDSDADYRAAVREGQDPLGVCLRLRSADLARVDGPAAVAALLNELDVPHGDVDLIVDLRELSADAVDFNIIGAVGVLSMIPEVTAWRSLTLAGSAFPADLTAVKPSSEERFARAEWAVWTALRERPGLARIPAFGDYTISHPDPPTTLDPRLLRVSAQLRYTTESDWLVFKERNIRDYGSEQFLAICERLVQRPEFAGADWSWGDAYIAARADGSDSRPGNPRTWRKVGTTHHIATVMKQIASLGA
jgi:hypothetical protein